MKQLLTKPTLVLNTLLIECNWIFNLLKCMTVLYKPWPESILHVPPDPISGRGCGYSAVRVRI